MRDLAYLLDCVFDASISDSAIASALDEYFAVFRQSLWGHATHGPLVGEIESEWRALFPVAWLDFQRFLQGWSPAYAHPSAALQKRIASELGRLRD